MKSVKLMVGAALSLATAACGVEPTQPIDHDAVTVDYTTPVISARDGHLAGTIGPVADVDAASSRIGAWDDGSYLAVESVAQLSNKAVMMFVSASNATDLFVPGTNETFTFGDYDHDGAQVGLLGCVGQEVDVYDQYDAPADEVTVVVDPAVDAGPADVAVAVTGTWLIARDGEETEVRTATTSFILER